MKLPRITSKDIIKFWKRKNFILCGRVVAIKYIKMIKAVELQYRFIPERLFTQKF